MLEISPEILIDESEIHLEFMQSSGPGGQNVNKVASAVQLRFDTNSPALPPEVSQRLRKLAGKRLRTDGVLVMESSRFRSQLQNRQDVVERFVNLVRMASETPKTRRKTEPSSEVKRRRLEAKRRRSEIKRSRRKATEGEE